MAISVALPFFGVALVSPLASVLASALACSVAPLVLEPMETCAGVTLVGAVFAGVDPVVDAGVVAGAPVVLAACSEPLPMPWLGA